MFVRSRLSKDIVYRKKGRSWIIKAGTVTYIDENQVTAKELRELYSTRIEIMSREKIDIMEKEIPVKEEIKKQAVKEVKKVQIAKPISKKEEKVRTIDEILAEIKEEETKPIVKVEIIKGKEPLQVTKDEIGDLVLEPVHAGANLKRELDAVQPVEVKKEEPVVETGKEIPILKDEEKDKPVIIEDKPKKGRRASTTAKKTTGKKRGRKKSTTK